MASKKEKDNNRLSRSTGFINVSEPYGCDTSSSSGTGVTTITEDTDSERTENKRLSIKNNKRHSVALASTSSRNSTRQSMNFEMLDPVLILRKKQNSSSSCLTKGMSPSRQTAPAQTMDAETQLLVDAIHNHIYSHKVMLSILEFVPLDLQRFYLNASVSNKLTDNKTVTSIMIRHLFGYFRSDATRSIHFIFRSLQIQCLGMQHSFNQILLSHGISPVRNAVSLELNNLMNFSHGGDMKVNLKMDKLQHLKLVNNDEGVFGSSSSNTHSSPREVTRKWIKSNLKECKQTLTSIQCDKFSLDTLEMMLDDFPALTSIRANLQFGSSMNAGDSMGQSLALEDLGLESSMVTLIESPRVHAQEETLGVRLMKSQLSNLDLTCDKLTNSFVQTILENHKLRSLKFAVPFKYKRPSNKKERTDESLELSGDISVDDNFMVNATGLASLPQLHSLTTLHFENVADFGREEIELIAEVKSLKNLSIINCGLTDETLNIILTKLGPTLEKLNISNNTLLSTEALKAMPKTKISSMAMLNVVVNKDTLYYLSCTKLRNLTLSGTFIGDSELATLFDFSLAKNLQHLSIEGPNQVTNTGLRIIKGDTPVLETLSMCLGDAISHRGLQFLSEHAHIKHISLRRNYSTKPITGIEALLLMGHLEKLELHNIGITGQELKFLQAQSFGNFSLKHLIIPSCEIDTEQTEIIMNHYRSLRSLEVRLPSNTTIEEWSMKNGIAISQHNTNETFVELSVFGVAQSKQTAWQRVLFYTIPTLQRVRLAITHLDE